MTRPCVHHWMVEDPRNGEQTATCKLCGAHTVFRPVYEVSWSEAATMNNRLNTYIGPASIGKRSV